MMERCLKRMLNQTIYVASVASYDGPQEVLSTPRAIKAYVEVKRAISSDGSGRDLANGHLVITEEEITVDDRIWLPGLDQTNQQFSRQPESVDTFFDERGAVDHYETMM